MAPRFMVDLAPLRESRDFRLLFGGSLISMLGNQLTTVAIPYQVFSITHSSLQVGLISLAQLVPLVLGSLVGGALGDAMDRRRLMLLAAAASSLTAAALAFNALELHSLLALYLVSALAAGLLGLGNPARSAAIPRLVKPTQLVAAYSFNQIVIQLATIAGPALAGILLAHAGLPLVYLLDALSFVASLGLTALIAPLPPETSHSRSGGLRSIVDGLGFLRGRQVLQGVYLLDIDAMVFGMPRALFPALAEHSFGGSTAALGALYAAPGLGALLGASTTGWVEGITRRGAAVVLAVVAWGVAIAAFGFSTTLWLSLVLLALAGWADVISAVLRNTILQTSIPDELRSRLSSFQMAVVQGGPRLGDLEAGAVASVSSTELSIVSGGIACIVGAMALARLLPDFWREGRVAED